MPSQTKTVGTCAYCQHTFSKAGMRRHLAACSARQAALATHQGPWRLGRVFHLRVEGRHAPEYWMHLEIPADETLYDLDGFLRETWVECCGHLSLFQINGKTYEDIDLDEMPPGWPPDPLPFPLVDDAPVPSPFSDRAPSPEDTAAIEDMTNLLRGLGVTGPALDQFQTDLRNIAQQATQSNASGAPPLDMLHQILGSFGRATGMDDAILRQLSAEVEEEMLNPFGVWDEEETMDTLLGDVLRPGLTFTYEYDMGSTTTLTLKVIGERSGKIPQEDAITVLARNVPPEIICRACGERPATKVCPYCMYVDEGWLCADCAEEHACGDEMMLPVVNSPRVGVCGYCGPLDAINLADDDF